MSKDGDRGSKSMKITCCWGVDHTITSYTASKQNVQQMSAQLLVLRYTENEKQSLYVEKISPSCWSLFISTYSPLSISSYSLSLRQTAQRRRCEWPRTKGIGHAKENTLHFMRGVVFWEQKIAFSKKWELRRRL